MVLESSPMTAVLIATPTPGAVKTGYTRALVATIFDLEANGITVGYAASEGGDLVVQRNRLATDFLNDARLTHLFFLDSDIAPDPGLCRRLLSHDKPVIGAVYERLGC
jgi:hypothetical protein